MKPMRELPLLAGISWLMLLAALCGAGANFVHPYPIPWTQTWDKAKIAEARGVRLATLEEVVTILEQGMHIVLDARPMEEYAAGHIPLAMPLPLDQFDTEFLNLQAALQPDDALLLYCSEADCDDSMLLGDRLTAQGYTNITVYVGGFDEWKAAGQPVE